MLYDASIGSETPISEPFRYVVTDSNRDRAHHWRSSQDVTGFTESADEDSDVLRFESGDQRLPVFEDASSDLQTISIQDGPVTAEASSYGERFAYLPEHRPAMAIDGDPTTAWLVADRAPAIGEFIELTLDGGGAGYIDLLQPPASEGDRTITEVEISADGATPARFDLDERSRTGSGQRIDVDVDATVSITITATTTPQPPIGEAIGGVGFAEIDLGLGATTEYLRPPLDVHGLTESASNVDIVLTRLRVEPTDRWRDDPEPNLARELELASPLTVDPAVTLRFDRRLDDRTLADLLAEPVVATSHLTGVPAARGAAAFDDDLTTAWITPFDRGVGERIEFRGSGTASELTIVQPGGDHSPITGVRVTFPGGSIDARLPSETDPTVGTTIDVGRPIDLSSISIDITEVAPRFVQNRRFNEPAQLPTAISEILLDSESPAVQPPERLVVDCTDDFVTLDGRPIGIGFDVATVDALAGRPIDADICTGAIELTADTHTVVSASGNETGFDVDRIVLSTNAATPAPSTIDPTRPVVVESSPRHRTLDVPPCPDGCWVILGEGFNDAWRATADGADLGSPTLIDGNANGWWVAPTTDVTRVEIDWPVQRSLNIAFALTALVALACLVLIVSDRRREEDPGFAQVRTPSERPTTGSLVVAGVITVVGAAAFIDWVWAFPVAAVWALAFVVPRSSATRLVGSIGATIIMGAGLVVTYVVRNENPFPDAGWPLRFEWLHGWTLLGVVLVVGASLAVPGRERDA